MSAADGITSAEGRLLAVQMGAMREDIREVKDTMREMARSLEKLVRIEEQQKDMRATIGRAFDEIVGDRKKADDLEKRVAAVERDLPGLRETRRWAVVSVFATLGAIGTALIQYFLRNHVQ